MALPHTWHWHDASQVEGFLRRQASGKRVAVAAVGGSVTAGINCIDGVLVHQQCSWPARVARWLGNNTGFRNLARGGVNSRSFLPIAPFVRSEIIDSEGLPTDGVLLLVDFSVNDAYSIAGAEFNYSREIGAAERRRVAEVSLALEALLRHLDQSNGGALAMLGILHACSPCQWLFSEYKRVFEHYQLPLLQFSSWPGCGQWLFARCVHPSAKWHRQVAETVQDGLQSLAARTSTQGTRPARIPLSQYTHTLWPKRLLDGLRVCKRDVATVLSAYDALKAGWTDDWRHELVNCDASFGCQLLDEGNAGARKPGWVLQASLDASVHASVRFKMRFGSEPRLLISYLQSYEGMGEARLTIPSNGGQQYKLEGTHSLRTSQVRTEFFAADSKGSQATSMSVQEAHLERRPLGSAGAHGFGVPAKSTVEGQVELVSGSKFKVVSIVSC